MNVMKKKAYVAPDLTSIFVEMNSDLCVTTSNICITNEPVAGFDAPEVRSNRGSGWEEYEQ